MAEGGPNPDDRLDSDSFKQETLKDHRNIMASIDSGHGVELIGLDTHSRCPCGKTDLMHCIDPPPECLSRRYQNVPESVAELDVRKGRDSGTAKKILEEQLLLETKKLKDIFADYAMTVYHCAQSVRDSGYLRERLRRRYPERVATTDMSDFEAVYTALTRDADFLYIEPFKHMLEACCRAISAPETDLRYQEALAAEEKYQSAFEKFAQLRVFSIVGSLDRLRTPVQEGVYPRLKIKVEENFKAFTINRVLEFKEKVRDVLHIKKSVHLRMTSVTQGCVEITFEVIGEVDKEVFEMDIEKKQALASNKISMLEYDGELLYCCCDLLSACDEEIPTSVIKTLYCGSLPEEHTCALDKDDHSHSPYCPSLKNENLKCLTEQCDYCEECMNYCLLEFHMMECDKAEVHDREHLQHHTEAKSDGIGTHESSPPVRQRQTTKRVSFYDEGEGRGAIGVVRLIPTQYTESSLRQSPSINSISSTGSSESGYSTLSSNSDGDVSEPLATKTGSSSKSDLADEGRTGVKVQLRANGISPLVTVSQGYHRSEASLQPPSFEHVQHMQYCENQDGSQTIINVSPTVKRRRWSQDNVTSAPSSTVKALTSSVQSSASLKLN